MVVSARKATVLRYTRRLGVCMLEAMLIRSLIAEGRALLCEELRVDEEKLFFFVRLPRAVRTRLTEIAQQITKGTKFEPEAANDHITLLYIPRFEGGVSEKVRDQVIAAAKKVAKFSAPIQAKIQGWGYFDGAQGKDNEPATAVVGLVDAPGLAHLHVALHQEILRLGLDAPQKHGYTPHATFAYLPQGERLPKLPVLKDSFSIPEFELSNDAFYRFPLKGPK